MNTPLQQKHAWSSKIHAPPEWGIESVPKKNRILGFADIFILWSSLGVGLLVLEVGVLLAPGLSLGMAFIAIVLGTIIGNLLLALVGVAGSDHGVPTMVLLRPVLGQRGSFIPSVLNLVQLIGWTAFELWFITLATNKVSEVVFGFSHYGVWLAIITLWCVLLALGGPLAVVRQWLKKFGVWLVYGVTAWITFTILTRYHLPGWFDQPTGDAMPFWSAVDLVIAMPISWMPLVADFNRFARNSNVSFHGTYLGYLIANVWFYGLGVLIIAVPEMTAPTPEGIATTMITLTGGILAMLVMLINETDNAFADLYSAAVSTQNIVPHMSQHLLIVIIGIISMTLAAFLTMTHYFNFLLLIGSVFVPLFGVFAADYFLVKRRMLHIDELYRQSGAYWYQKGFHWQAIIAWVIGIATYHMVANFLPSLGASLPGFFVAFAIYLGLVQSQRL